jgi:hypothetical protein
MGANIRMPKDFYEEKAEVNLVWQMGSRYPKEIECIVFERNGLDERRLKETKRFKLVEVKD